METYNIEADENWKGKRVDKSLADYFDEYSRSFLKKLLDDGNVLVNDKKAKPSLKIASGDKIDITIPDISAVEIEPEDIPLDIVYEDDDIIIVNKPKGMVVHPAPGHYSGTIVNALMYYCDDLSGINGELRPGIVHRIDQDTTGVIVACKNDKAHRCIAEQLKEHSITRTYHAIVCGHLKQSEGTIEGDIGRHPVDRKKMAINVKNGKKAVTHYKVLDTLNNKYTYIECKLETGRTHQIRVHMASIGHPILGDTVYGPAKCPFKLTGQTLHAKTLGFIHPTTGQYVEFDAELPNYFKELLNKLRK